MAAFSENRSLNFGKYAAEQDIVMPDLLQLLYFFDRTFPFLL